MQLQKPPPFERVRDDGHVARVVAAGEVGEAQEREEEVLVRVGGLVFDGEALGADGDGEVVVCEGAVLRVWGLVCVIWGLSGWGGGGGAGPGRIGLRLGG